MNQAPPPTTTLAAHARDNSNRRSLLVLATVFALFGPVAAFAKMGTVPLIILAVFAHKSVSGAFKALAVFLRSPIGMALVAVLAWCAISNLWAPENSVLTLLRLATVIALAVLVAPAASALANEDNVILSKFIVATTGVLIAVLLFEGLSGAALHKLVRPEDAVAREGEWVPYLEMVAARGTAILAPLCFLIAPMVARFTRNAYAGAGMIAISLIATLLLPMAASSLAILAGAAASLISKFNSRVALATVFAGLAIATLGGPWLVTAIAPEPGGEFYSEALSRNQQQRVAIWSYTAEQIREQPLRGYGFDSARHIGGQGDIITGTNWPALPLHPHNAALQIWLELGLVGAVLTTALLFFFWRALEKLRSQGRDIGPILGCISAVSTLAMISFGVWQFWWMATWGLLCGTWAVLDADEQRPPGNNKPHYE
jgi:O-antigen ligase